MDILWFFICCWNSSDRSVFFKYLGRADCLFCIMYNNPPFFLGIIYLKFQKVIYELSCKDDVRVNLNMKNPSERVQEPIDVRPKLKK